MDEHQLEHQLERRERSSKLAKLSPAKLALLEKRRRGEAPGVSPNIKTSSIERVSRDQPLPLTFLLESVLEKKWSALEARENNLSRCVRLTGAFNEEAMHLTVNELARRHEALRTRLPLVDGRPAQVIAPSLTLRMPVVDLQHILEAERLEEGLKILGREAQRPYDLSRDILWRVHLARLAEDDHLLLLGMSHLISDAWSMDVLVKDSFTLYRAFSTGQPSPLAELPIQFADYAYWQRNTLQGRALEELISYWKQQLDGLKLIPEIRLPIERSLPAEARVRTFGSQHLKLPAASLKSLKEFSQRESVTLFMLLFATLVTVLHRYTGKDDFGIVSPMAKRERPETRKVIGWFANLIVLRVRLSGVETFSALLQRVRKVVLEAYEHQDLPFSMFDGNNAEMWNNAETYPSVRFNMLMDAERQEYNSESIEESQVPGLALAFMKLPLSRSTSAALPGITVIVQESEKQLGININYERERYEAAAVRELLENYRGVLESAVVNPGQRLSEFPLSMRTVQP